MSFREIDRPDPNKFVEFPPEHQLVGVSVPPLQLYKDEIAFWHQAKNDADQRGDVVVHRAAQESGRLLRHTVKGRVVLEAMMRQSAIDPLFVGAIYVSHLLAVSHTRLLREIVSQKAPQELGGLGYDTERVGVVVDYSDNDVHRSGVHATPAYMEERLDMQPPARGKTKYFEGEAIYLTATAPARPTAAARATFQRHYKQPFKPNDFVSITARLKGDFWNPGPITPAS